MRHGDLSTGAANLDNAWKTLRLRWETTSVGWHDAVSHEFEASYLDALDPQIKLALERMRTLAATFAAARHECDDQTER